MIPCQRHFGWPNNFSRDTRIDRRSKNRFQQGKCSHVRKKLKSLIRKYVIEWNKQVFNFEHFWDDAVTSVRSVLLSGVNTFRSKWRFKHLLLLPFIFAELEALRVEWDNPEISLFYNKYGICRSIRTKKSLFIFFMFLGQNRVQRSKTDR